MLADFGLTRFSEALVGDTQTPFVIVARAGTHGERCGGGSGSYSPGLSIEVFWWSGRPAVATSTITRAI